MRLKSVKNNIVKFILVTRFSVLVSIVVCTVYKGSQSRKMVIKLVAINTFVLLHEIL